MTNRNSKTTLLNRMKVTFCFLFICMCISHGQALIADSGYADQFFLDNAVQYNEDTGVKVFSNTKKSNTQIIYNEASTELDSAEKFNVIYYDDPNLVPSAELPEDTGSAVKKNAFGFTFSQMAKRTLKTVTPNQSSEPYEVKTQKKFGFTFSDMAKIAQKAPTLNIDSE